jgi:3-oxoacid CoA-transferase A subunit
MPNKVFDNAADALADVSDGVSIAMWNWGLSGTPHHLIRAIMDRGIRDITLYCTLFVHTPIEDLFPSTTSLLPQLKKLITAGIGGARIVGLDDKDFLRDRVETGQLETEVLPFGIWIERLHAAAMQLGGFYNPVGVGTTVEAGKERKIIDGKEYFFEKAFQPDVGIVKAYKADRLGNLTYYGVSRGASPIVAMASKLVIAEADELLEPGEIDPEMVVTPGVFVDRVVKIPEGGPGSEQYKIDNYAAILENEFARKIVLARKR